MPSLRVFLRLLLEPVLAVGLFCIWVSLVGLTFVNYVPLRASSFETNPYAILVAVGFVVAVASMRLRPTWSVVLVGGLLLVQVLYWPARFGQSSWIAYLALPVIAFGVGLYAHEVSKRIGMVIAAVVALATSALLNVPALSLSGVWGAINGKPAGSGEILPGLLSWTAVGLIVGFAMWRVGVALRRRIREGLLSALPSIPSVESEMTGCQIEGLSARENDIYRLIVSGMSNREIAVAAGIEESTVKSHVSNVLAKLNLRSRAQLIALHRNSMHPVPNTHLENV